MNSQVVGPSAFPKPDDAHHTHTAAGSTTSASQLPHGRRFFPDSQPLIRVKSLSDGDVRAVQKLRDNLQAISKESGSSPGGGTSTAPDSSMVNSANEYQEHTPTDLVQRIKRMNVSGYSVGETVLVRCSASKWQSAEILKVTEEGVRLWVAAARAAVDVPVQLIQTHLSKSSGSNSKSPRGNAHLRNENGSATDEPLQPKPPGYVKSPIHAVRPAHLSHRQLYQHVPTEGNCGFCNQPMPKGSVLASWSCGHKIHFTCAENRFRSGFMGCAMCQDDESHHRRVDSEGNFTPRERTLSGGSTASTSSFGNSTFGDSTNGSCARSESCGSSGFEESSAVPNFVCVCGHTCSMANMEEEPRLGELCCPVCQYNPWRPSKTALISQRSLGPVVRVVPSRDSQSYGPGDSNYFPPAFNNRANPSTDHEPLYHERSNPAIRSHESSDFMVRESPSRPWMEPEPQMYQQPSNLRVPKNRVPMRNNFPGVDSHDGYRRHPKGNMIESSSEVDDILSNRMPTSNPGPRRGGLRRTRSLCQEDDLGFDFWPGTQGADINNSYDNASVSSAVSSEMFDLAYNSYGYHNNPPPVKQHPQDRRRSYFSRAVDRGFLDITPQSQENYYSEERCSPALEAYRRRELSNKNSGFESDTYSVNGGVDNRKQNILSWNNEGPWISVIKDGQDLRQRDLYSGNIPPF